MFSPCILLFFLSRHCTFSFFLKTQKKERKKEAVDNVIVFTNRGQECSVLCAAAADISFSVTD